MKIILNCCCLKDSDKELCLLSFFSKEDFYRDRKSVMQRTSQFHSTGLRKSNRIPG